MGQHTENLAHLERGAGNHVLRSAVAASLDRIPQRASNSSAKTAKWLGFTPDDVDLWRRGITVTPLHAFTRLATALEAGVNWHCTGQTQGVQAVRL